ncbi:MAG: OmpA family protein [Bacteroidales bacterium]|nr:OmpA family protein [Bacteroidales bacterium]
MYHRLFSLIVVALIFPSYLSSQTDVKIRKKEFKTDRTGFEAAWQHVVEGDSYFRTGGTWYGNAFEEYSKAALYNNFNPELNYKAGVAALYSDNKESAAEYFQRVLIAESGLTGDLMYFTGRALQYSGKYAEAAEKLSEFLKSAGKKEKSLVEPARKIMAECLAAAEVTRDTLRVEMRTLDLGINTVADEYAQVLSADRSTMYFTSRRPLSNASREYEDSKYDENILFTTMVNGNWGMTRSAGKNLTTRYCEAPLYLSQSGEELYIYAGYENGGDILVSVRRNDDWKKPRKVPFGINTSGNETSLTFSPDGREVAFVSERGGKDGLGGKDIYIIKMLSGKKWSKPANAGPMINSPYDEESPRFSDDGDTLFFSSMGHNTIGGFDIFYSVRDMNGSWGNAVNYGYPVNTPWDEIFFYPMGETDSTFYLASNRPESRGGLDIFRGRYLLPEKITIPAIPLVPAVKIEKPDTVVIRDTVVIIKEVVQAPPPPPPAPPAAEVPREVIIYLTGKVSDSETGEPVLAKIDVIDLSTDAIITTTASSDVDGTYRVKLPERKAYMIDVRGTGFLSEMKRVSIPSDYSQEAFTMDVSLVKVKVGKKVVLNNILFETGKSVLTAASYTELDRLYGILTENTGMKIEISGHTDKTGSEPLNFRLSEARAKAVVDYLLKKGIDPTRLEYRGFGSLQPIADNATPAGRTMNRRVEFKILEL